MSIKECVMNGKVLQPVEYKVIVLPDLIEETDDTIRRCKAMGLEIPKDSIEKDKGKQITGTLIRQGGRAFEDFGDIKPEIGELVYFAKWAGIVIKADDETEYRLMSDKDITAVLV